MSSLNDLPSQSIDQIKKMLTNADALIFSAGAGMGVDSGLPDFRGNQGMWKAYPALGKQRIDFMSIANPKAFKRDPRLAWGFYGHRLQVYRNIQPHQGFVLLLDIAELLDLPYFVFTSNVDGQFQKAGFSDQHIYECHGSIHHLQCSTPCTHAIWTANDLEPSIDQQLCHWQTPLPSCPYCNTLARPNILMFDDYHWIETRQQEQYGRLKNWLNTYKKIAVIEIGAGTAVPTVRYFSEKFSPHLIRINPRQFDLPNRGGIAIKETAYEGILKIKKALSG